MRAIGENPIAGGLDLRRIEFAALLIAEIIDPDSEPESAALAKPAIARYLALDLGAIGLLDSSAELVALGLSSAEPASIARGFLAELRRILSAAAGGAALVLALRQRRNAGIDGMGLLGPDQASARYSVRLSSGPPS